MEDIRRGDGAQVIKRIETLCTISKDGYAGAAGSPLVLRPWQKQLLLRIHARRPDGKRRHRVVMVGMPRKNGKSALGSGEGMDGLLFDGRGAEVYSAAAEKEQARIVFGETKRMFAAKPELAELVNPMKDVIEVLSTGSIYRVLSAEAYSKEGLNISRNIIDELHAHPDDELLNVLLNGTGARDEPLTIIITTAGVVMDNQGRDSVCYRFFQHGVEVAQGLDEDPGFFFAWWGAPDGADHTDPEVWKRANPGYGDILNPEDMADALKRLPENEFRTKRLNQWVGSESAWLPAGAWDACKTEGSIADGDTVFLGFDGSRSGDTTALVVAKPGAPPFVDVVRVWDPSEHEDGWTVPPSEVEQEIRRACKRWRVREVLCDPYLWQHSIEGLAKERLPMVEFPQTPTRMIPATQRFYEAVLTKQIAHNGNEVLARHLRAAVLKTNEAGSRIVKESKGSGRHIDAALAAVLAFDHAAQVVAVSPAAAWIESMVDVAAEPEPIASDEPEVIAEAPKLQPWSPWGTAPERDMPDQTRAAMDLLRNLPPGR